ncbi:hypothetical protein N9Y81_01915 [Akkermansiaceae bacterium]|nr:hypothetical protein [Akkermansiaceae bacterium]
MPVLFLQANAQEVELFNLDYTGRIADLGKEIEIGEAPYPGRSICTEINLGKAVIGFAPSELADTAALLSSDWDGESSFAYFQLQLQLMNGGVYAFRKNRIEIQFQFTNPDAASPGDEFSIFTDGGVTYSLHISTSGQTFISTNVIASSPWGDRVTQVTTELGSVKVRKPIHLIWEIDDEDKTTTVTLNGSSTTFDNLSVRSPALRNSVHYPGPMWIRLNYNDTGSQEALALKSVRVTGSKWDGPLFRSDAAYPWGTETGILTLDMRPPQLGTWQPEYSFDGSNWTSFGSPVSRFSRHNLRDFDFGTQISNVGLVRFREVQQELR